MRKIIATILFVHFFLLFLPFSYFWIEPYSYATSGGNGSGLILVPIIFSIIISIALLIIFYILKIYKKEYFIFNVLISIVTYINCIFIYFWNSVYVYQLYNCETCYTFTGKFFTTLYFVLELVLTFFVLKKYLNWSKEND